VDDGSQDETGALIAANPRLRVSELLKKCRKSAAIFVLIAGGVLQRDCGLNRWRFCKMIRRFPRLLAEISRGADLVFVIARAARTLF